jgi:hypothetical protein
MKNIIPGDCPLLQYIVHDVLNLLDSIMFNGSKTQLGVGG